MEFYYGGNTSNSADLSENFSSSAYDRSSVSSYGEPRKPNLDLCQPHYVHSTRPGSPGHDLGYHTLLTARPPCLETSPLLPSSSYMNQNFPKHLEPGCYAPNPWTSPLRNLATPSPIGPRSSPFPRSAVTGLPMDPLSPLVTATSQLMSRMTLENRSTPTIQTLEGGERTSAYTYKGKKLPKTSLFDKLPDDVILRIFSFLSSNHLCVCARVCRRWYFLAWEPQLWATVNLSSEKIQVDRGLKTLFRLLCRDSPTVCLTVERIALNGCLKLTDKGLGTIARRCPELRSLEIRGCTYVSNLGVTDIVSKCLHLEKLELTGCFQVTTLSIPSSPEGGVVSVDHLELETSSQMSTSSSSQPHGLPPAVGRVSSPVVVPKRRLHIQHLDLTDCHSLEDFGLKTIVSHCPHLTHLYLRRCIQLTDSGIKALANYCIMLRELSVSDCLQVTDFGMYELAKLGPNLRYLSVAKCDQISDAGIKQIARLCYKLRYLNARGCEAVSDDSMEMLARSCTRLRALDIGKCDVTDHGLKLLSENCPNLKKLSIKSCDMITDKGIQAIAYFCRGLQQLNIQDCHVTLEGYRLVKKFCKRCIIEHTNPGFY